MLFTPANWLFFRRISIYSVKGLATEETGLNYLEAWTRDDEWVNQWYEKSGFDKVYTYLHVYLEGDNEIKTVTRANNESEFQVIQAFAHYSGAEKEYIKSKFNRVHECNCYEKKLEGQ